VIFFENFEPRAVKMTTECVELPGLGREGVFTTQYSEGATTLVVSEHTGPIPDDGEKV